MRALGLTLTSTRTDHLRIIIRLRTNEVLTVGRHKDYGIDRRRPQKASGWVVISTALTAIKTALSQPEGHPSPTTRLFPITVDETETFRHSDTELQTRIAEQTVLVSAIIQSNSRKRYTTKQKCSLVFTLQSKPGWLVPVLSIGNLHLTTSWLMSHEPIMTVYVFVKHNGPNCPQSVMPL